MSKNNIILSNAVKMPEWVTIEEAVNIANRTGKIKISMADIYRQALLGEINISIYFQSPISIRKVKILNKKIKITQINGSLIDKICSLESNCFIKGRNLIISTEGDYISLNSSIIDTSLIGYEYILIQRLLANSLGIPMPMSSSNYVNFGILALFSDEVFQLFEKTPINERVKKQVIQLPKDVVTSMYEVDSWLQTNNNSNSEYFPIHDLPKDACFVIRISEVDNLVNRPIRQKLTTSTTRISTPLSRLFWLACKNNESISPLLKQPYKLLSIFEQWALADGITDHLSGDTLKTAIERGSPSSISTSN